MCMYIYNIVKFHVFVVEVQHALHSEKSNTACGGPRVT